MTMDIQVAEGDVERLSLRDYTEKAYLDYSMYVILDRKSTRLNSSHT